MNTFSLRSIPQNQAEFDNRLYELPHQRKEVLKLYLQWQKYLSNSEDSESENTAGVFKSKKELDYKIAKKLEISKPGTVRSHIFNARKFFGLIDNEPYPREKLVELFYQYKRDWIEPYDLVQHSSNFYMTAGISYFDRRDYRKAIELFKKAVDGDRTDPIAQIYLNSAKARHRNNPFKIAVVVAYFRNEFHINAANNVLRGIADAQTKFNNSNGKDGRLLEIVLANDDNQPLIAMEVAKYLAMDKNIVAIIGHHSSESTKAALGIYEKESIAIVSPTSTSSKIQSKNFFRTIGSTKAIASKYVSYIKDYLHLNRVAIFHHPDNEYSQTLTDDFTTAFEHRGGIIDLILDMGDPHLDLDKEIKHIKMVYKVEIALVLPSIETNCVAIAIANKNAQQPQSQQLKLLFATSLPEISTLAKGGAAVEGAVLVSPSLATNSIYMNDAKDRWQQSDINWRVATSYDATQAIIKAIETSTVVTRATILDNLETITLDEDCSSGFGLTWSDSDYHSNSQRKYCITQIRHNKFEEIS